MIKTKKIKKIVAWLMPDGVGMRRKLFFSINLMMLVLILMLGFSTLSSIRINDSKPDNAYATLVEPTKTKITRLDDHISKLEEYSTIWKRNLFNTSGKANPVSRDESADVKIVLAKKDMGLKLIGTVVSDNPDLNRAFILNLTTGVLKTYRTGRKVDGGLITKIKDVEVIISTENSNELLALRIGDSPTPSETTSYAHEIPDNSVTFPQASAWNSLRNRGGFVAMTQKEVKTSLADIDKKVKQFEIAPFIPGKMSMGFRIKNIIPDSIFDKIGLRYGEAITAVNGQPIAGPSELFQRLKEGGKVTIKVQKSRSVRRRTRFIHLDIG